MCNLWNSLTLRDNSYIVTTQLLWDKMPWWPKHKWDERNYADIKLNMSELNRTLTPWPTFFQKHNYVILTSPYVYSHISPDSHCLSREKKQACISYMTHIWHHVGYEGNMRVIYQCKPLHSYCYLGSPQCSGFSLARTFMSQRIYFTAHCELKTDS